MKTNFKYFSKFFVTLSALCVFFFCWFVCLSSIFQHENFTMKLLYEMSCQQSFYSNSFTGESETMATFFGVTYNDIIKAILPLIKKKPNLFYCFVLRNHLWFKFRLNKFMSLCHFFHHSTNKNSFKNVIKVMNDDVIVYRKINYF